jgi:ABC-type transport system involved in cytochrome c biogenesis permease subunit
MKIIFIPPQIITTIQPWIVTLLHYKLAANSGDISNTSFYFVPIAFIMMMIFNILIVIYSYEWIRYDVFDILMSIWNVIVNVSFSWTIYAIITP